MISRNRTAGLHGSDFSCFMGDHVLWQGFTHCCIYYIMLCFLARLHFWFWLTNHRQEHLGDSVRAHGNEEDRIIQGS